MNDAPQAELTVRQSQTRAAEVIEVGAAEAALLSEAGALCGTNDAAQLIRIALKELIERRRFQNWVDAHDDALPDSRLTV